MPLILEGLVTTTNRDGSLHLAPMGPVVDRDVRQLTLRPYRASQTFANLKESGVGVFHVTDDVELVARAAIHQLTEIPPTIPATAVPGRILANACRWFAFRVHELHDQEERTRMECTVVDRGSPRDFFGFNRAKHAVLEAAILATRVGILPDSQIRDELRRLAVVVEKTAGDQEARAWELLMAYIQQHLPTDPS